METFKFELRIDGKEFYKETLRRLRDSEKANDDKPEESASSEDCYNE